MKQIIGAFLLLFTSLNLFAQTIPEQKPNSIVDGKRQGDWVIWYKKNYNTTDVLDSVAYFRKISFENGIPVDTVRDYYKTGILKMKGRLSLFYPLIEEGKITWYFESGNIKGECNFIAGKKEGEEKTYYNSGKLKASIYYINGVREDMATSYHENGEIQNLGYYKNGKKTSSWTWYFENGATNKNCTYKDGKLEGKMVIYHKTGEIAVEQNYRDNILNGEVKAYNKRDKLHIEGKYSNGERTGTWTWYGENGKLFIEGNYNSSVDKHEKEWAKMILVIVAYSEQENYAGGIEPGKKAVLYAKEFLGTAHKDYILSLNLLASFYRKIENFEAALPLLIESVDKGKKHHGIYDSKYGAALNGLAILYEDMGQYEKALPLYLESLETMERSKGKNNSEYANVLSNIAGVYESLGQHEKAIAQYKEVLLIVETNALQKSNVYGNCLNGLAVLYNHLGQYQKALPLLQEALKNEEELYGKESESYAVRLNNLASLYEALGEYKKVVPLFLEALSIIEKKYGKENSEYGNSLNNLAAFYWKTRDDEKAIVTYLEALTCIEKSVGKDHIAYSNTLGNLATVYTTTGQFEKALPLTMEAIRMVEKILGKDHPAYADRLNNLAVLHIKMGEGEKALSLYQESLNIIFKNIDKTFCFLSEKEKTEYMALLLEDFKIYNIFLLNYSNPLAAAEAFNIELAVKGMILNSGMEMRQNILAGGDSSIIEKYIEWKTLKNELAKEYSVSLANRRTDINDLETQANKLEGELASLSSSFKKAKSLLGNKWTDIQNSLKSKEIAIEFTTYIHFDSGSAKTAYVALVLRKGDKFPHVISLCGSEQLDSLLKKESSSDANFISSLYRGTDVVNTKKSFSYGKRLFELIWKPLDSLLSKGDKIYFAPSGLLHQIAFAAIPYSRDLLLSDRYNLNQLSSTAMLLKESAFKTNIPESMAVFGGIQYDATEKEIESYASIDTFEFVSRSLPSDLNRGETMDYLPGTLSESKAIVSVAESKKIKVNSYYGLAALEENYKKTGLGKSPQVIHIATHGFFFPDPKIEKKEESFNDDTKQVFKYSDNPLNRSGLLFAGANNAWAGKPLPGMEDGILTAYEAANVSLNNTQLVVLSACETGLGDIKGSEGVFGLQRAFKMAGAEYLMMSLWKVPDAETAEFMTQFYTTWFSGKKIPDAFTETQNYMKAKYPKYPYKWAAFVLVK